MSAIYGIGALLLGLPMAIWPYRWARFNERIDAVGSKRSASDVEPADWNVLFTRLLGIGLVLFGVVYVLFL